MPKIIHSLLLIVCLLAVSCSAQRPGGVNPSETPAVETSTATAAPTPAPSATPDPSPTPTPSATLPPPTPTAPPPTSSHYQIDLELDYSQKSAEVKEKVDYTNLTGEALSNLQMVIPPLAYPGTFTLKTITWGSGQAIKDPSYQGVGIVLALDTPLQPNESLELVLDYHLALPAAASLVGSRPIPFGYTSRQVNLVNWYPFIPPYKPGTGWLAHPFSYYGESMVYDTSDFDINLTLTSPVELAVAASAPAEQQGDFYQYHLSKARSFAFSFSHEYQITRQEVGGVEINAYSFAVHANAGKDAPQIAAKALSLFQDRFGAYPRRSLAVVEADFQDGMEYDGLIFISKGMYNLYTGKPDDYLTSIIAHETAHQWWYALVGNDQALEPWLDEALSTYCELLFYEQYYPESEKWWWDVRVHYYNPQGWVNSTVYDQMGRADSYEEYRNAVYLNGAVFFSDLRKAIGDEAFFAFLKDYAKRYAGKIATGQDFFTVLAEHSSVNIQPILRQYFKQ